MAPWKQISEVRYDHGPFISDDRMTGHNNLDFLQNGFPEQLEEVPLPARVAMYLQHEGAPSRYTRLVMQISVKLSLIGTSVVAGPLTGHQDLHTSACYIFVYGVA
jgi:hypothetical protein